MGKILFIILFLSITSLFESKTLAFENENIPYRIEKNIFLNIEEENLEKLNLKELIEDKINQLNMMLKSHPNNFKLHYLLAEAHRNIGNNEAAIVEYSKCVQTKSDEICSYIGLATVFRKKLGHPEQLINYLTTYKKFDTSLAYYALGYIDQPLEKIEKISNAEINADSENIIKEMMLDIEYLTKSIEINSQLAEAHFELANAYKALGLVYFLTPDNSEKSLEFMKFFSEEYKLTVQINPNHLKAHYYLAEMYNGFNNKQEFLEECKKIIEMDPELSHSPSNKITKLIKDNFGK